MFYAYLHIDPRDGTVRYVGVGSKSRGFDWNGRAPVHVAWIAELDALDLEPVVAFPFRTRNRDEAFEAERDLIRFHRAYGSPLFNITDGGLGTAGLKQSQEQKEKLRAIQIAKWLFDPEFRARRLPDMAKARAARNRSPKQIAAVTKHPQINGSPCRKCGGTLRYKTSRNCVNCARKP